MATKHLLRVSPRLTTRINLAIAGRLTGKRHIASHPKVPTAFGPEIGTATLSEATNILEESGNRPVFVVDERPLMENLDVWKDRIPKKWRTKWQRLYKRLVAFIAILQKFRDKTMPPGARWMMLFSGRELTDMELYTLKENDERRRLNKFHKERALRGGKMIITALTNLRMARIVTHEKREIVKKRVRFDRVEFSPLAYRYHVDALRSPVSIADLNNPDICTHLSASVEHPVRADLQQIGTYVTGLWYTIEIAATLGIPNQCKFSDLLQLIPDSAPPLAFLVGYGENKRPEWRSLEDMPHFLGGGQTNGGKSNMMHVMLCTMIARNSPADVNLLMVDLKFGGIELGRYEGLPHLISKRDDPDAVYVEDVPSGIAENTHEGLAILEWLAKECERRGRMFKSEKIQNLKIWNRRHRNRHLPELVVAIDELGLLMDQTDTRKLVFELVRRLASTARAAGGHLIAFTQSANKAVINETIKINFPGRVCFSTPDAASSILFVGDGAAQNLMPAGRAVFKFGTTHFAVQTPLIEPGNIAEILENAKAGKTTHRLMQKTLSPEEIIDWAIEDNASSLAVADTFSKFGSRMEKALIERTLQDMEGKTYTVGDRYYQVLPGAGSRPRIVVRVDTPARNLQDRTQDTTVTRDENVTEMDNENAH